MSEVERLERALGDAKDAVRRAATRRRHWRTIADNKSGVIRDRRDIVLEAREERAGNRNRLIIIRDKIEELTADTVITPDEQPRYDRLSLKLEDLVDDNEEITALIHRQLAAINEIDRKRDHARELAQEFGEEWDIAVARRERIKEQLTDARKDAANNVLGTDLFVLAEFDCNNGNKVPQAAYPALRYTVLNYLVPLRKADGGAVIVNSGFRDAAYNRAVGGASLSMHVYVAPHNPSPHAAAVDHWKQGWSHSQVQTFHRTHTHPDGMGVYTSFTHVDPRGRIGWADAQWNGP